MLVRDPDRRDACACDRAPRSSIVARGLALRHEAATFFGIESTDRGLWVVQSLSFDPGRQLSYEEAQVHVGESLANLAAEKVLNRFLARHKRGLRIEAHPELVMRVDFSDPMDRDHR